LLVVLAAESLFAYRGPLAQRYPVTRPWIESACARAGCGVPWSRDEQMLRLEDSELLEVPGRPQEIALGRASAIWPPSRRNTRTWSSRSRISPARPQSGACCGPPTTSDAR
jgi:hypothetical protein